MQSLHFLVVDSDTEQRNHIKFALERAFKESHIDDSADYDDTVIKLSEKYYDLLILNTTDKAMKPKEILKTVASQRFKKKTYCLVIVSKGDRELLLEALNIAADGYIYKPFTIGGLVSKLVELDQRFDRRQFCRESIIGNLLFEFDGNTLEAEIVDISLGGVLVNLQRQGAMPQILQKIKVLFPKFSYAGEVLSVDALVIRIQAIEIDPSSKTVRYAVKFVGQDQQKVELLKEAVEQIKAAV